jgi:hypothetical protein
MAAIRERVPPLRGFTPGKRWRRSHVYGRFAASPLEEGYNPGMSVAASRLVHILMPVFLGLTPQAMNMPPLRGFEGSRHDDGGDPGTRAAASRLVHVVMPVFLGLTPQAKYLSPLRGFEVSRHEDGGDPGTRAAAARLHSRKTMATQPRIWPLRGFTSWGGL